MSRGAFDLSNNLEKFIVSPNSKYYKASKGILYDKTMTKLICYPNGKKNKTYYMPNSVKEIDRIDSLYLKKIKISKKVKMIKSNTFFCNKLVSLELPKSVKSFGKQVVDWYFTKLKKITVYKTCKKISSQSWPAGKSVKVYCNKNSKAYRTAKKNKNKIVLL